MTRTNVTSIIVEPELQERIKKLCTDLDLGRVGMGKLLSAFMSMPEEEIKATLLKHIRTTTVKKRTNREILHKINTLSPEKLEKLNALLTEND